jgi:hypothetical protein
MLFVDGSIRVIGPFLSVANQTLSSLAVIPPSGPAGAIGSVALIVFFAASVRTSAGFLPQTGAHTLPKPKARPEQDSPEILMVGTNLLVEGSIRRIAYGFRAGDPHSIFSHQNPVCRASNLDGGGWLD